MRAFDAVRLGPGGRRFLAVARLITGSAILVLTTTVPVRAQQPDDAARLALVRERYAAIQAARMDSAALDYMAPGGYGVVTVYRTGSDVRKLVVTFDGDGASGLYEYFFWSDTLQFAFRRWSRYPEEGPSAVGEDRWYFASGRAFRWQQTEEDGTRHIIAPTDPRFARNARGHAESARCWLEYHAEGEVTERVC